MAPERKTNLLMTKDIRLNPNGNSGDPQVTFVGWFGHPNVLLHTKCMNTLTFIYTTVSFIFIRSMPSHVTRRQKREKSNLPFHCRLKC